MNNSITYVAMDTHKKQHSVALLYPNDEKVIQFSVNNTPAEIRKMVRKIKRNAPSQVQFCYEAGVCGFTLQRRIVAEGCPCIVIAPSLIPKKPGERKKTDRRDAKKLLRLFMADMLTEVYPPDEKQEAARELTRCREAAQENLKRVRHQLQKISSGMGMYFLMVNTGRKNIIDGWKLLYLMNRYFRMYLNVTLQRCDIVCNVSRH